MFSCLNCASSQTSRVKVTSSSTQLGQRQHSLQQALLCSYISQISEGERIKETTLLKSLLQIFNLILVVNVDNIHVVGRLS